MSLTNKDIIAKCKESVLRINVYGKNGVYMHHGSAVVLKKKGIIITNFHIIFQSSKFKLYQGNKEIEHDGIIIIDPNIDILLLKIDDTKSFPDIPFNTEYEVSDDIFAIGNPERYTNSVTKGNINGRNRFVESSELSFDFRRNNLIQIDASLSQGNSGGGLFNLKGELIGITTLTDPKGQNLNFAVPIDEVLKLLKRAPKTYSYKNKELKKEISLFHLNIINGDYIQSLIHLDKCIHLKNKDEYFLMNKISLLTNFGQYDEAILICDKQLSKEPNNKDVNFLKFGALVKSMQFKEALKIYNKSTEFKNNYSVLVNIGAVYLGMLEFEKALIFFNKAIIVEPNGSWVYLGLSEYFASTNQYFKAGRLAYKIYKKYPSLNRASYVLGLIYYLRKKFAKSVIFFDEFIKREEDKIKTVFKTYKRKRDDYMQYPLLNRAKTFKLSALIFLDKQNEANDELNSLIDQFPNETLFYVLKAQIKFKMGDINEAFKDINKAISTNPNNIECYGMLGYFYSESGNYVEALKVYRKALRLNPKSLDILENIAYALINLRKFTEVVKINNRILKIKNNTVESDQILANLMKVKKNYIKYLYYTNKLIQTHPNDYSNLILHADALNRNGISKEALIFIDKTLNIKETFYALVVKAMIFYELKKYRDAIILCDNAKEKYKENNKIIKCYFYLTRGKSHLKIKNFNKGISDLENAKVLNQNLEEEINSLLKKAYKSKNI